MTNEIIFSEIPEQLVQETLNSLWDYTIGLVRIGNTDRRETADLLGSGVLVTAEGNHAILTADHVLDELPKSGKLGFILGDKAETSKLDVAGLQYESIGSASNSKDGPDLAIVRLSDHAISTLGSRKSFFQLEEQATRWRENPPKQDLGLWVGLGFVDELSKESFNTFAGRIDKVVSLYPAYGSVTEYSTQNGFDYFDFQLHDPLDELNVASFGGMSGCGLWQVLIDASERENIRLTESLLRGIAYFQNFNRDDNSVSLSCHAHKSIFETVVSRLTR